MKPLARIALGAAMLAGAATALAAPASARVFVGIGAPGYLPPPAVCDPYSPYYDPYYCGYGGYGPAYVGGPVIGLGFGGWGGYGGWHGGGFHGGGFHGGGFRGGFGGHGGGFGGHGGGFGGHGGGHGGHR